MENGFILERAEKLSVLQLFLDNRGNDFLSEIYLVDDSIGYDDLWDCLDAYEQFDLLDDLEYFLDYNYNLLYYSENLSELREYANV